jgi:uncharacterized membrane protein (UPF0127 family)
MMKIKILLLLLNAVFLFSNPKWIPLYIGSEKFTVEIADTVEKRIKGLMFRKNIPQNYGMLFVFEREEIQGFWMKNTVINLDIIFLDKDKRVVHIISNVPPCQKEPCPVYRSARPAKYVLELRGERLKSLDLKVGDLIFFVLEK